MGEVYDSKSIKFLILKTLSNDLRVKSVETFHFTDHAKPPFLYCSDKIG